MAPEAAKALRLVSAYTISISLALLIAVSPAGGQDTVFISRITPDLLAPGQGFPLMFEGEGFMPGCEVTFQPPHISVNEIRVFGPFEMEVDVQVSPSAEPGEVTVIYTFEGTTASFHGLLAIEAVPQVGGVSPDRLSGPQDMQSLEVYGDYFNGPWVDSLEVSATMASGSTGYDLDETVFFIDAHAFGIDLDTPPGYYESPCSIFIEITDTHAGIMYSYEIPVDVEEPEPEPEVTSVTVEPDATLALGIYPLTVSGLLTVEGTGLSGIDPSTIGITGHSVPHLELLPGSVPSLSDISIADSEITASFAYFVVGDDHSFTPDSQPTGDLEIGTLTEPFDYTIELDWPLPNVTGLSVDVLGTITGTETGGVVALSGEQVPLLATAAGDYLRDQPDAEILVEADTGEFGFDFDIEYSSDTASATIDILLEPVSLPEPLTEVSFMLYFTLGGATVAVPFACPVELGQVLPEPRLGSVEFVAGPYGQPGTETGQLLAEFTGDNLDLLGYGPETITISSPTFDFGFTVESLEDIDFSPGRAEATYEVVFSAPDVTDTPLVSAPSLSDVIVTYPLGVRFEEFSPDFSATFFSNGETEISMSYVPEFSGLELAGDPVSLGNGNYSLPVAFEGTNLLPKYFDGAAGAVEVPGGSAGDPEFTSLEITGGDSSMLAGIARFNLSDLIETDPTPRDESFSLTIINSHDGTEHASEAFEIALGLNPVFSGLEVTYPGVDQLVSPEFEVSFEVSGMHLAPQYLEGAGASLRIIDPPVPSQFNLLPVEITSFDAESVECLTTATAVVYSSAEPVVAELTILPEAAGAAPLRAEFVLDVVLPPLAQSLNVVVDEPLAVENEDRFVVEFEIGGQYLRPEYFEDLRFETEFIDPVEDGIDMYAGDPEIDDLSAGFATGSFECTIVNAPLLTDDQLNLRCSAFASGLDIPAAVFILEIEPIVAEGDTTPVIEIPGTTPTSLNLFVDEYQQLVPQYRTTGVDDGFVAVELELELAYETEQGFVRNIRGLTFDPDTAADAFVLHLGDEEYTPADLERLNEGLLSVEFELPEGSFETTGVTPAMVEIEPEDLAFAFDPILGSDQRTVEVVIDLHWSAGVVEGDADVELDFQHAVVVTSMTLIPAPYPEEMFRGEMAFLQFEWESYANLVPVYNDDGMLIGFDRSVDLGGNQVQLDPAGYCDTLNLAERVSFHVSIQKGLRTLDPEPLEFLADGTAVVALDLGDLADDEQFEINGDAEEEKEFDWNDLWDFPLPEPLPLPEPDFEPHWVDMMPGMVMVWPGEERERMPDTECYAAREAAEEAENEHQRRRTDADCEDEYQAYQDANDYEWKLRVQKNYGDEEWTPAQEAQLNAAIQARQAAWDAYEACMKGVWEAYGKMRVAQMKSWGCEAPVKTDPDDPDSDGDGLPDSEDAEDHYVIDMSASASGERRYGVDNVQLDFTIPRTAGSATERGSLGQYDFGVVQSSGFAGQVLLDGVGQGADSAYALDQETGEIIFGDGERGARLPAGEFQTGDMPELTIEVSDPAVDAVNLVPLFNEDAEPDMAVGVSVSDGAIWPEGWDEVGDPAVITLEPWAHDPGELVPTFVPYGDLVVELYFEPVTPIYEDNIVTDDLLFAEFKWWIRSNVRLTQSDGWMFELDRGSASTDPLPVRVRDSDANAGNLVRAGDSEDPGTNENWDFGELEQLTGTISQDGQVVGTYTLDLDLDGTATLKADTSDLERTDKPFTVDIPPEIPPLPPPEGFSEASGLTGEGTGPELPKDPFEELRKVLLQHFILSGGPWIFFAPDYRTEPKIDCDAAREELKKAEEEACDCDEEEEALDEALDKLFDALDDLADAKDAKEAADKAKEEADETKEEADQAVEDAEEAEKAAQEELERYINEEVPGATAVSGTASEAGAHGAGAQHAGGFACGSNFVGARIGDDGAWNSHRSEINSRMQAWKNAYRAAKKARREAEAADEAAEQAAEDAEQAQEDLDAAEDAADEAWDEFDAALAAWEACMDACEESMDRVDDAKAKVAQCEAQEGDSDDDDEEETGAAGGDDSGTGNGSGDEDEGGEGDGGGTATGGGDGDTGDGGDSAPDSGGEAAPGGQGTGPSSGTSSGSGNGEEEAPGEYKPSEGRPTAGPDEGSEPGDSGGGGSQGGGSNVRPPGGWPWEQPPPSSTGDEELDDLIKMFERIAELIEQWEKLKKELKENDLVKEVELYRSIADLLDNLENLDTEVVDALKAFVKCDSEPLEELLAKGGDKIDAVIAALSLLKGAIGVYLVVDSDMPAGRKAALEKIKGKLDKAVEALEDLKDKAENASELAAALAKIKEGDIWPDDVIGWLEEKIGGMLSDAAEEAAKKAIEQALIKALGSKAIPLLGILKDLGDFGSALGTKWDMDDLDEAITNALLAAIAKANSMTEYSIPCEWTSLAGKYVWIAGTPEDFENTEVKFKWEKRCFCSDGEGGGTWKTFDCPAGAPTVEDKNGRRYWTFPNISLPKTDCNPCIITVDVTIKRGDTVVTHSLLVGVQVCK